MSQRIPSRVVMTKHLPFAAACLAACTTPVAPTGVPVTLQVPAPATLQLEALATGVQVYECARKPDATFEWTFKSPEATLADRAGRALGRHYAGPTWEADDGSRVVGEVKARDPGPLPSAIPWLLLAANSTAGVGTFADTRYVQRLATAGGQAPASGCAEASIGRQARVPYTATYYFYR